MTKLRFISNCTSCFCLLLSLVHIFSNVAFSHNVVEFLPGFDGPLPFYLETGYVGVGESEDVQLFYYFIKSEGNPKEDPLLLWLTGGPGCSALSGLVLEIGPIKFKIKEYDGSLPTFVLNPYSWTKVSSIIFVDSPVGTGFSYARTPSASYSNDALHIEHLYEFLRKWLTGHPEFYSNAFYVGGDSYSGMVIPGVAQKISEGNEGSRPLINLQGYLVGNGVTWPNYEFNFRIPYAHGMGLISDELFESLKRSCGGEYRHVNPSNADCLKNLQEYKKCTEGLSQEYILEAKCPSDSPPHVVMSMKSRSLYKFSKILEAEQPLPAFDSPCIRTYPAFFSKYWANDDDVRKVLHITKGTVELWQRCNYDIRYQQQSIVSSIPSHVYLSTKSYRSLIYSGDHDFIVPFLGTQAWIRNLNYSIVDDWRPWVVEEQVAGYARTYSDKMTFATVKGGGHTATEYKPKECFAMFKRWILHETL